MSIRRIADRSFGRGHALPAATGPAGTVHGPAVDLKPRAGAATGGYLVIDQSQADAIMNELEREKAINPITMERPELRASIFRVEARTPKPNGDPRYSYWDPAELWRWLQQPERQGRMPDTNEPAWFEDWWALYYTYGAPAVPSWAYSLEKRNPDTQPSASVRGAALGIPPAQRRNAVRDRSVDRPTLPNDGGQGPQAAPGSDALAAWRDAVDDLPSPPPPMGRTPTLSEDGAAWWRGEISREEAERRQAEARAREREERENREANARAEERRRNAREWDRQHPM